MTNTFIPILGHCPLYCVWIETGNPTHPLDHVWFDPELRSFETNDSTVAIQMSDTELGRRLPRMSWRILSDPV
jgi:hypothetical protein